MQVSAVAQTNTSKKRTPIKKGAQIGAITGAVIAAGLFAPTPKVQKEIQILSKIKIAELSEATGKFFSEKEISSIIKQMTIGVPIVAAGIATAISSTLGAGIGAIVKLVNSKKD